MRYLGHILKNHHQQHQYTIMTNTQGNAYTTHLYMYDVTTGECLQSRTPSSQRQESTHDRPPSRNRSPSPLYNSTQRNPNPHNNSRSSSSQRDGIQGYSRREYNPQDNSRDNNRTSSPWRGNNQQQQYDTCNERNAQSDNNQEYNNSDTESYNNSRSTLYIRAIHKTEECPPQIIVWTPYNVTIQPHNRTHIPLRLTNWRTSKVLLLEPRYDRNHLGLRVARRVVWINRSEYCPVWNDTHRPITLKYGTAIAIVSTTDVS